MPSDGLLRRLAERGGGRAGVFGGGGCQTVHADIVGRDHKGQQTRTNEAARFSTYPTDSKACGHITKVSMPLW